MRMGAAGTAVLGLLPDFISAAFPPSLEKQINELEYLTRQEDFGDVSRGKPRPHSLSPEERKRAGLTPDTWKLEVLSDPANKADIGNPMTIDNGNPFDWTALMKLAKKHTVSFPKIMTCNNIGEPLGMGIWEGVPLRHVIWMAKPKQNLRRVFYHGFHNNDPKQMFRSSLPVGRVLEEPFGLPPVIMCFKLNGHLLHPKRGAPVRMVIPEAYGFKNVKWLNRLYLTNLAHANDTYIKGNNDIDSWLKTFARPIGWPRTVKANQAIPVTGYSQVGISGLSKVQYWITRSKTPLDSKDPYFANAPWKEAEILAPPTEWGGELPDNKIPAHTHGFDKKTSRPKSWPLRLAKAHWAVLIPGLPAGRYDLRFRSIDANDVAQPMPRPFRKSGRNAIEKVQITVES